MSHFDLNSSPPTKQKMKTNLQIADVFNEAARDGNEVDAEDSAEDDDEETLALRELAKYVSDRHSPVQSGAQKVK